MNDTGSTAPRSVEEEYRIWKKNAPSLYDQVFTMALTWPSLTCEWAADKIDDQDKQFVEYRLVLGTHTAPEDGQPADPNHLMIARLNWPRETDESETLKMDDKGGFGGYGGGQAKFEIYQRINHDGEVNRARAMPQNQHVIATRGPHADVHVFDNSKFPLKADESGESQPTIRLHGHDKEGYGLSWNVQKAGLLVSSADDHTACLWDITQGSKNVTNLDALSRFVAHEDIVEDVAWHPKASHLFVSVGDDKKIIMWDTRDTEKPAYQKANAHAGPVNCVSWNPAWEYAFATGSKDKTVSLWDMRHFKLPLHSFCHHTDEVFQVAWSPHMDTVLASAGNDRRVMLWDIENIGKAQTAEEAKDGPPELLFVHGGHTGKVVDLSWNPHEPWLMASVDEHNLLHVWRPAASIVGVLDG